MTETKPQRPISSEGLMKGKIPRPVYLMNLTSTFKRQNMKTSKLMQ